MKKRLKFYNKSDISRIVRHREFETKVGERVGLVQKDSFQELADSECRFVILGVAEDIGVRANHGRAGASSAFKPALDSFLNQQSNVFFDGSECFILGELDVADLLETCQALDHHKAADLLKLKEAVSEIDHRLQAVIADVVSLKKIPIVIGGGHNNAYGNISGCFRALGKPVNVINCDPHLDFRPLEGRHSGNAFRYAFEEGTLARYAVFGMHEQYNNSAAVSMFSQYPESLFFRSFESIFIRGDIEFSKALEQCISFVRGSHCGVELDLDAITNVPSSAKTSSGISATQARQFVHRCASGISPLYLHIAEGAPVLSHIKADNKTGKLISYLITDFIKGFKD